MRNSFIQTLVRRAKVDPKIFLLTGDIGFSLLEPFAEQFPDRFLNVGIAEQNMMGIAAGLSREGYTVFTYSIGNFPTLRCMEQIRYDICYHQSNVKIIAVGAGYAYGSLGVSHHTTEDLGMLRTLPNMVVTSPGDPNEVGALTDFLCTHNGPCYMRLNKVGEPILNGTINSLSLGEVLQVKEGEGTAVLTTGAVLPEAFNFIRSERPDYALYSFPFVSPIDTQAMTKILNRFPRIMTVEEHQMNCGFGSAILEIANDLFYRGQISKMPPVQRVAIPNKFVGFSGSQEYLRREVGLSL